MDSPRHPIRSLLRSLNLKEGELLLRRLRYLPALFLAACAILCLTGSRASQTPVSAGLIWVSTDPQGSPSPAAIAATPVIPIQKLQPAGSQIGIVIGEPLPDAASMPLADFGAGCGRWLFLNVGGNPDFGQTPLWSEVARAENDLGKPNLQLTRADALRLPNVLGVTQVAVGTITGTDTHCTLTYQLVNVPGGKPLGGPISVAGSQKQVIAQLPQMAMQMLQRLKLRSAKLPAAVGAVPTEMQMLGQIPWDPDAILTDDQTTALHSLSARLPLAGILALRGSLREHPAVLAQDVKTLMAQAPQNTLVYGLTGYVEAADLPSASLLSLRARYPKNYALAHAEVWWRSSKHDPRAQLVAAQQAVRDAPHNPDAWLSLGSSLSNAADQVRRARIADDISPSEWRFLNKAYPLWFNTVSRAAHLDPRYGKAWERVAQAATFAGQQKAAEAAFWKAVSLEKKPSSIYTWGLQMFQPKWGGSPADLAKVASLAAAANYSTDADTIDVSKALKGAGFQDLAQELLMRSETNLKARVQAHPDDGALHWSLASIQRASDRQNEAVSEYQAALHVLADDYMLHYDFGQCLDDLGRDQEAVEEYRQALRLNPDDAQSHFHLGWDLQNLGQLPEAQQQLLQAIQLDPDSADAIYVLGLVYELQHEDEKAIVQYRLAAQQKPSMAHANQHLLGLLDAHKQYDEAIAAGARVVMYDPQNATAIATIADCFSKKKDFHTASQLCQKALEIEPDNALAHLHLGDAYLGLGQKEKAQAEWQRTLQLDYGEIAKDAREELNENP